MADGRSRVEPYWSPKLGGRRTLAWLPLAAAAGVVRPAIAVRNLWWRRMARDSPIPAISIGNLTVGGSSKTPFTLFLANHLQQIGFAVGIVSRGWRRAAPGRPLIAADRGQLETTIQSAGDEPAMMARAFGGPIAVARRRIDAIRLLAGRGPLDVVVLDDGFQHTRLKRAVDLLLVSRERGLGNGWMLPAGPLRDPLRAARRADAVILVTSNAAEPSALTPAQMARLERQLLLRATIRPRAMVYSESGKWRETAPEFARRRTLAVSGLADSSGFYAMLHELNADLIATLEFPDHHAYSQADWQMISTAARAAEIIVTTEKDLIKLERFPFARDSLYALRLEVSMADDQVQQLDELILSRVKPSAAAVAADQEISLDAG